MKRYITLIVLFTIALTSCSKKGFDPVKQAEIDDADMKAYLNLNLIDAQKDEESGIYYKITTPGNTIHPEATSTVTVYTEIKLLDGTLINTATVTQPVNTFIIGLRKGLLLLDRDAEAIMLIPSGLAYGPQGFGAIPSNSVLVYKIKLINISEG